MARPRTFDDDKALDAAVACFWRQGLEATSVRELAHEMGLNGPSVYNAFGDKRALFVQALDRYVATTVHERLRRLEALSSPKDAIHAFFSEIIARSVGDPDRRGCFLVNTALDAAPHDAEIGKAVSRYLGDIERFFRQRLSAACALGEAPASLVPIDTARMLLGLLVAIRVIARTDPTRARLEGMIRPALAMLDLPRSVMPKRGAR